MPPPPLGVELASPPASTPPQFIEAPTTGPRTASFNGADGLAQLSKIAGYGTFTTAVAADRFAAGLTVVELDRCRYVRLTTTPHTFATQARSSIDIDVVEVFYLLAGTFTGSQDGRTIQVLPGRPYLLRSAAPFEYTTAGATDMVRLTIPRDLLPVETAHRVRGATATELPSSLFATAALAFITALTADSTPTTDEQLAFQTTIIALTHGLVLSTITRPDPGSTNAVLRDVIDGLILDNLADPNLSPAWLAKHAGVSLRHLHRLFENEAATPATYIRNLRLDAIATELVTETGRSTDLNDLATRHGFTGADVATRAFKRRFHTTMPGYRFTHHTL